MLQWPSGRGSEEVECAVKWFKLISWAEPRLQKRRVMGVEAPVPLPVRCVAGVGAGLAGLHELRVAPHSRPILNTSKRPGCRCSLFFTLRCHGCHILICLFAKIV